MTWYEEAGKGHRARFPRPGQSPGHGPVFPTRAEAKAWAVSHGYDTSDMDTIAELLEQWRKVRLAEDHGMPSYIHEVEERLTKLAQARRWVKISDITVPSLDAWKTETGGRGVARSLSYLLGVLRWGRQRYGIPIDERVLAMRRPRQARRVLADDLLTDDQIAELQDRAVEMGPDIVGLIHYLITYGPRPITACTRLVRHVSLAEGTMLVQAKRSGEWRHALLPESVKLWAPLITGRAAGEPLFLDPRTGKGWPVDSRHRAAVLGSWYERVLGVPLFGRRLGGIYNLKRYAITRMLKQGMDAATVAKFTGHLTLSQVLLYARGNEATTRDALHLLRSPGKKRKVPPKREGSVGRTHTRHTRAGTREER